MNEDSLRRLDESRCLAISTQDGESLTRLISDDLSHVHADGECVGKSQFIAGIQNAPRTVTRGEIRIKLFPNFAVMTGTQINTLPTGRAVTLFVTQVWAPDERGDWRQLVFHASGVGSQP
jgi:hypothetical protein